MTATAGPVLAPPKHRAERLASYDPAAFARPSSREEAWRFCPLGRLAPLLDGPWTPAPDLLLADAGPHLSYAKVTQAHGQVGLAPPPIDQVAALAWVQAGAVDLITLEGSSDQAATGRLVLANQGEVAVSHLVIHAKAGSKTKLVLDHKGQGRLNQTVEVVVDEAAELTLAAIHNWDGGSCQAGDTAPAAHHSAHRLVLGPGAKLRHILVNAGGGLIRSTVQAALAGQGAQLELDGINLTGAGQHHEAQLLIDHQAPDCVSRATYKGALLEPTARSVWVGDVVIRAQATGTDTYQENRNLVLAKGARADSVPNLEILTGKIEGAGHASATGQFDAEQLFYLMSRGISAGEARSMVVRAFFAELIGRLDLPGLEQDLLELTDRKLQPGGQT
ncbi:MAG: SufD family Fe-S cluster assembly protein [Micrococcales bacterium]|nr:SufD family Fe-S cluster assembly protein [Micrococcales bacterium]